MQAFFGDCAHPLRSTEVGLVLFRTLVDGTVAVFFNPFSSFGSGDAGRSSMMDCHKEAQKKVCRVGASLSCSQAIPQAAANMLLSCVLALAQRRS